MPSDEPSLDFECPNCHEPVDPSWKACPSCAVEFLSQDEEVAAAPAPPSAAAAPQDDLDEIHRQVTGELATVAAAPAAKPPAKTFAKSSGNSSAKSQARSSGKGRAKAPSRRKPKGSTTPGGPLALIGLLMIVAGGIGAVVVGEWDTIVRGAAFNDVGWLQLIAIVGAIVFAGAGVIVLWLGTHRAKRGARTA